MVSKISKKTIPKYSNVSPKSYRRRQGKLTPSPIKTLNSAVTSINRSFRSCRRRLLKIFASLTVFHTPNKHKNGFRRLAPLNKTDRKETIQPPLVHHRRTICFDLDETLIHSSTGIPPENYDFIVTPVIDGQEIAFYVLKRPGADELLTAASELFEVVIFTAGLKEYASLILDKLDPNKKLISHRFYRDSCRELEPGKLVKDLGSLGRDLGKIVIVDDNPASFALQKENAIPIPPFISDLADRQLSKVIRFLKFSADFEDMREAVASYLSGEWKNET